MKKEKWQYPDTTGWAEFPHSVEGVNFVTKTVMGGDIYYRLAQLTGEVRNEVLSKGILELMGHPSSLTIDAIKTILEKLNEGCTHTVLELVL